MEKLIKCELCNNTIKFEELNFKDKDVGNLCQNCYNWLNKEFIPLYKRVV